MKKLLVVMVGLVAVPALAGGKDFKDGLSKDEVVKLTKSLGALEAKYNEARPKMEALKKNPDVRKNAKLTATASEVLKHYTTVGVWLNDGHGRFIRRPGESGQEEHAAQPRRQTLANHGAVPPSRRIRAAAC